MDAMMQLHLVQELGGEGDAELGGRGGDASLPETAALIELRRRSVARFQTARRCYCPAPARFHLRHAVGVSTV